MPDKNTLISISTLIIVIVVAFVNFKKDKEKTKKIKEQEEVIETLKHNCEYFNGEITKLKATLNSLLGLLQNQGIIKGHQQPPPQQPPQQPTPHHHHHPPQQQKTPLQQKSEKEKLPPEPIDISKELKMIEDMETKEDDVD